ncbi:membrane protein [Streptococcus varani]|uniref:Membrane protein n=2 Tax=Bacteria TaxID=2 RepID=A0A0E4H4C3_9STRE|nr:DUF1232 domain-containing protein [Streptococcus varani]CQR24497.1 membrane protein [Streptococcus varani]
MFIKCIIDKAQAKKLLKGQYNASRQTIESPDKLEKLLQAIERKLKIVPFVGKKISKMAVMISLVKAYVEGRYREIPIGSLIAIVAALIYFLTPVDMMPDIIPSFGFLDDAAVVSAALLMVQSDIDDYIAWRKGQPKKSDQ